jgi:hypothetical protein
VGSHLNLIVTSTFIVSRAVFAYITAIVKLESIPPVCRSLPDTGASLEAPFVSSGLHIGSSVITLYWVSLQ